MEELVQRELGLLTRIYYVVHLKMILIEQLNKFFQKHYVISKSKIIRKNINYQFILDVNFYINIFFYCIVKFSRCGNFAKPNTKNENLGSLPDLRLGIAIILTESLRLTVYEYILTVYFMTL